MFINLFSSGGSNGGEGRVRPLSKFFQFHAVFGENWQNRMLAPSLESWCPHLGEILDPPLLSIVKEKIVTVN